MEIKIFKKTFKPLLTVITLVASSIACAGGIEMAPPMQGPFLSLFGGANWVNSGTTTAINISGLTTNLYAADSDVSAVGPIVGGEVGYHWSSSNSRFWVEGGAESSYTTITSHYGLVHPLFFINPGFDTLSFNYQAQFIPLLGLVKLGGKFSWFEPYLVGGAGISWNKAFNYNEIPTDPNSGASPMRDMFTQFTQIDFAWTAGAGFGFQATQSTAVALEYRYTSYGNLGLNPAGQQTTAQTVSLGEADSNALLLRMTVVWAL